MRARPIDVLPHILFQCNLLALNIGNIQLTSGISVTLLQRMSFCTAERQVPLAGKEELLKLILMDLLPSVRLNTLYDPPL